MGIGTGRFNWPLDLVVIALVVFPILFLTLVPGTGLVGTPLHVVLGFAFVFYVPGAAFASALFPRRAADGSSWRESDWSNALGEGVRITLVERLVLSLGLSVAIVPLVGLLLMFTDVGVWLDTIIPALSALSLALAAIGAVRRVRLPPEERFGVRFGEHLANWTQTVETRAEKRDRLFSVVIVAGLLLAATGIGYAVWSPEPGERFTEFYVQTRDPATGQLVADGYPEELGPADRATMYVGLTNQEHRTVSYSVVVQLQRLESPPASATVLEARELDRFAATVAHNETWRQEVTLRSVMDGEDLRLAFLLYRGDPPAEPSVENAYRSVHLWVDMG